VYSSIVRRRVHGVAGSFLFCNFVIGDDDDGGWLAVRCAIFPSPRNLISVKGVYFIYQRAYVLYKEPRRCMRQILLIFISVLKVGVLAHQKHLDSRRRLLKRGERV
jgi:hypothetical protein